MLFRSVMTNYKIDGAGLLGGTRWTLGLNWRNDTWLDTGLSLNTRERRSDEGGVLFAVISKDIKLKGRQGLTLRLNVGNLTNRDYITEGSTFGEKRTYRLATDFRF